MGINKKVNCPSCGKQELSIDFDSGSCGCSDCKYNYELQGYIGHRTGRKCQGSRGCYPLFSESLKSGYPYFIVSSELGFVSMAATELEKDLGIFRDFRLDWPEMVLGIHPSYIPNTATCPLCDSSEFVVVEDPESHMMMAVCSCGKYSMLLPNYVFAKILQKWGFLYDNFFGDHLDLYEIVNLPGKNRWSALIPTRLEVLRLHLRVSKKEQSEGWDFVLAVENRCKDGDFFDQFVYWTEQNLKGLGVEVKSVNKIF